VTENEPPRWTYRLSSYRRALSLLDEAVRLERDRGLTVLERMGLAQAFEITVELGWKLIKDVLEAQGLPPLPGPNAVVRAGFEAELVSNGRGWLRAISLRNSLSHMYKEDMLAAAVPEIVNEHHPTLLSLPEELRRHGIS